MAIFPQGVAHISDRHSRTEDGIAERSVQDQPCPASHRDDAVEGGRNTPDQFVASAVAEEMAPVMTLDNLKAEAALGDQTVFQQFLRKIPDSTASEEDVVTLL